MPELPEVEVTRRGIEPFVAGRRVERVDVRTPALRWPIPPHLAKTLKALKIDKVERRGKYLLFETVRRLADRASGHDRDAAGTA